MNKGFMRSLGLCVCLFFVAGCESINMARTVAGGACGTVNYSVVFMGTPLIGIEGDRGGCDLAGDD